VVCHGLFLVYNKWNEKKQYKKKVSDESKEHNVEQMDKKHTCSIYEYLICENELIKFE
jgi:hypothetical protein